MASKLVAVAIAATGLLIASSVFDGADARRGGGGGGGLRAGGGGHSMGMRSMGPRSMGPRSMGPRSMGVRSFSGGNMGRVHRGSGGYALRSYGGGKAFAAGKSFPGKGAHRHHRHKHAPGITGTGALRSASRSGSTATMATTPTMAANG